MTTGTNDDRIMGGESGSFHVRPPRVHGTRTLTRARRSRRRSISRLRLLCRRRPDTSPPPPSIVSYPETRADGGTFSARPETIRVDGAGGTGERFRGQLKVIFRFAADETEIDPISYGLVSRGTETNNGIRIGGRKKTKFVEFEEQKKNTTVECQKIRETVKINLLLV